MEKASKSDWSSNTSGEEPDTSENNLKKRKASTVSVPTKKLVNLSSASTSGDQLLLDAELFKSLIGSDSSNCTPSEELEVIPSTSNENAPKLDNPSSASTSNSQNMLAQNTEERAKPFMQFLQENWKMLFGNDSVKDPDIVDLEKEENPDESASQENLSQTSTIEEDSPDSDYASSEEAEVVPTTSTSVTQPDESGNAPVWRLLRRYGRKFLNEMEHGDENYHSVKDYIQQIRNLINSEESVDSGWYFVNDYQIVTPDGKLWFQDEIENIARANILKNSDDKSLCGFEECKECSFKSIPAPEETVRRHIIRSTGALYYCVPCGEVFSHRKGICSHTESCPCRFIMAEHNDVSWENIKPQMKREKPLETSKVFIEDLQERDYGAEFNDLVADLLTNIQRDGLLNDKTKDELMDAIKKDPDYDVICLFDKINNKTLSKKQFKVNGMDNYYTILYPTTNQEDLSKSVMFHIIEVVTKKIRSLHRLEAVRDHSLSFRDMKCHYEYCKCKQSYENPDPVFLVGHILAENFLIACVGCKTGFIDFSEFENHFNDDCYIKRKPYSPKCRKIM